MAKDWQGSAPPRMSIGRMVAIAAIASLVAAVVPFADQAGPELPSFLASILSLTAITSTLAAFLLFQEVLSGRDARLAGVGAAFLFSALGVVPMTVAPHVDLTFWSFWEITFAALVAVSFVSGSILQRFTVTAQQRRRTLIVATAVPFLLCGLGTALIFALDGVVNGTATEGAPAGLFAAVLVVKLVAVFTSAKYACPSQTVERVIPIAMLVGVAELIFLQTGVGQFSVGWYLSLASNFACSLVIVFALLASIAALYRRAEQDKLVLEDEALRLLQQTRAAQYREDRVRRIIENAADAYIEISNNGVIQAWNTKAADMFGWRSLEAIGQPLVSLIMSTEGESQLQEFVNSFWEDEDRFDGAHAEIITMNRNGVEFPVEVTMWVDESDFEPQMNFFLRDITTRRQADEQLQRALEDERQAVLRLQELDRAKTDFVSSVSHELRSPLTSTLGFLELLADGDAGDLTPDQLRMIEIASRNARRLFVMIEDLLTLSRIEENAFRISYKPVRMDSVIETIVERNQSLAQERGLAVDLDVSGTLGICVGDEQQLARAIDNIVGNAVKFTPEGGRISVAVRREAHEVVIAVADNGIGIPVEEQKHLFDRFFRASVAVESQSGGTGLGLTIAKAIIDHHNGTIEVHSELGIGTTVTLRCPALPVDETVDLASA